jgi:predicted alpha/beta-hydrolase family hydrolase
MKKSLAALLAALPLFCGMPVPHASAAITEQLLALRKPNGTALRYLLSADDAVPADIGVILFTGGQGQVHLDAGIPNPGANFLVRSRQLFAAHGLATAVYDPSADIGSLNDAARMSSIHAEEVAQMLADFRNRSGVSRIYLVGTSRGTISAAYLANALGNRVDGVVLTSTLFSASRAGPGLSGFDFASIRQPLLFVHHVADSCRTTAPAAAQALSERFPVIWVEGVEGSSGDACGPYSAHGYLGREAATVKAIADWIRDGRLAPRIGIAAP